MRSSFEMTRLIFLCCPAETLQISRLFGVPACVSTSQPNKTSHNQWNKHIFGKNVFSSWYSLRNICFWQKFKLVIFLESPQISGGFWFKNKCHSQYMIPRCPSCIFSGPYPLGQSSFKTRAIRFYHFMLNWTSANGNFVSVGQQKGGLGKWSFKMEPSLE